MSVNDPQWGRRGGTGNSGDSGGAAGKGNEPTPSNGSGQDRPEPPSGQRPNPPNNSGGNRPAGPPDLDELWRNFNERLSGLFGKKRPPGGPIGGGDSPPPSMRQLGGGIGLISILALIVWLGSGFFVVDAQQRALVLTFGKFKRIAPEGLNWRMPYPIQTHELVDVSSVRKVDVGYQDAGGTRRPVPRESLMLTRDQNIIDLQFEVQYNVRDPVEYLFSDKAPADTVKQAAETAIREIVGNNEVDAVLYGSRGKIESETQVLMQQILDRYKIGVQVRKVNMQAVLPPDQVRAAFDDVVKAKQDADRFKNEGQAYANDIIPKARGAGARLSEEANGYRETIVANAQGEAARFSQVLREYERAPQVTRDRLYIDTVQQIMTSTTKVMIDAKQGNNMLFLPLDKIIQMTGAAEGATVQRPAVVEQTSPPEPPPTRREMLRGRDREAR
jgi:modulator of FtsH protease HflK